MAANGMKKKRSRKCMSKSIPNPRWCKATDASRTCSARKKTRPKRSRVQNRERIEARTRLAAQPSAPEPGTPESAAQVRERPAAMIRKELPQLPALTKVYNEALKKEAEEQVRKKDRQKETMSKGSKKKSV